MLKVRFFKEICAALSLALIILIFTSSLHSQSTASYGTTVSSLSTTGTGAISGTAFAVPAGYAAVITWQVIADGSVLSVNLEGSLDNSNWGTIDSQTTAAGGVRTTPFTAVKFVRISQVSRTGGTTTTGTLVTNRGFITTSSPGSLAGFSLSGNLTFAPDNTYDIGASGATRPRALYTGANIDAGTSIQSAGNSILGWTSRSKMFSPADSQIRLSNNAGTDFSLLQFGGTTSAFSALKRVGTEIQTKLADDSGFASMRVSGLSLGGSAPVASGLIFNAYTFATLPGAPTNGTFVYCSDCTIANPCASAGTGAMAKRLNGVWVCN